jgi:DNA-binding NtrC family response regulator
LRIEDLSIENNPLPFAGGPLMASKEKYNVLLVDDEESVRFTLDKYLKDAGYKVDTASCLSEAYSHLKNDSFDIAIIDRMLTHGENGMDLVHYIGKRKPACRTIMISAYPSLESEKEAECFGAFIYLVKPVRKTDILFAVAAASVSGGKEESTDCRKHLPAAVYVPFE